MSTKEQLEQKKLLEDISNNDFLRMPIFSTNNQEQVVTVVNEIVEKRKSFSNTVFHIILQIESIIGDWVDNPSLLAYQTTIGETTILASVRKLWQERVATFAYTKIEIDQIVDGFVRRSTIPVVFEADAANVTGSKIVQSLTNFDTDSVQLDLLGVDTSDVRTGFKSMMEIQKISSIYVLLPLYFTQTIVSSIEVALIDPRESGPVYNKRFITVPTSSWVLRCCISGLNLIYVTKENITTVSINEDGSIGQTINVVPLNAMPAPASYNSEFGDQSDPTLEVSGRYVWFSCRSYLPADGQAQSQYGQTPPMIVLGYVIAYYSSDYGESFTSSTIGNLSILPRSRFSSTIYDSNIFPIGNRTVFKRDGMEFGFDFANDKSFSYVSEPIDSAAKYSIHKINDGSIAGIICWLDGKISTYYDDSKKGDGVFKFSLEKVRTADESLIITDAFPVRSEDKFYVFSPSKGVYSFNVFSGLVQRISNYAAYTQNMSSEPAPDLIIDQNILFVRRVSDGSIRKYDLTSGSVVSITLEETATWKPYFLDLNILNTSNAVITGAGSTRIGVSGVFSSNKRRPLLPSQYLYNHYVNAPKVDLATISPSKLGILAPLATLYARKIADVGSLQLVFHQHESSNRIRQVLSLVGVDGLGIINYIDGLSILSVIGTNPSDFYYVKESVALIGAVYTPFYRFADIAGYNIPATIHYVYIRNVYSDAFLIQIATNGSYGRVTLSNMPNSLRHLYPKNDIIKYTWGLAQAVSFRRDQNLLLQQKKLKVEFHLARHRILTNSDMDTSDISVGYNSAIRARITGSSPNSFVVSDDNNPEAPVFSASLRKKITLDLSTWSFANILKLLVGKPLFELSIKRGDTWYPFFTGTSPSHTANPLLTGEIFNYTPSETEMIYFIIANFFRVEVDIDETELLMDIKTNAEAGAFQLHEDMGVINAYLGYTDTRWVPMEKLKTYLLNGDDISYDSPSRRSYHKPEGPSTYSILVDPQIEFFQTKVVVEPYYNRISPNISSARLPPLQESRKVDVFTSSILRNRFFSPDSDLFELSFDPSNRSFYLDFPNIPTDFLPHITLLYGGGANNWTTFSMISREKNGQQVVCLKITIRQATYFFSALHIGYDDPPRLFNRKIALHNEPYSGEISLPEPVYSKPFSNITLSEISLPTDYTRVIYGSSWSGHGPASTITRAQVFVDNQFVASEIVPAPLYFTFYKNWLASILLSSGKMNSLAVARFDLEIFEEGSWHQYCTITKEVNFELSVNYPLIEDLNLVDAYSYQTSLGLDFLPDDIVYELVINPVKRAEFLTNGLFRLDGISATKIETQDDRTFFKLNYASRYDPNYQMVSTNIVYSEFSPGFASNRSITFANFAIDFTFLFNVPYTKMNVPQLPSQATLETYVIDMWDTQAALGYDEMDIVIGIKLPSEFTRVGFVRIDRPHISVQTSAGSWSLNGGAVDLTYGEVFGLSQKSNIIGTRITTENGVTLSISFTMRVKTNGHYIPISIDVTIDRPIHFYWFPTNIASLVDQTITIPFTSANGFEFDLRLEGVTASPLFHEFPRSLMTFGANFFSSDGGTVAYTNSIGDYSTAIPDIVVLMKDPGFAHTNWGYLTLSNAFVTLSVFAPNDFNNSLYFQGIIRLDKNLDVPVVTNGFEIITFYDRHNKKLFEISSDFSSLTGRLPEAAGKGRGGGAGDNAPSIIDSSSIQEFETSGEITNVERIANASQTIVRYQILPSSIVKKA